MPITLIASLDIGVTSLIVPPGAGIVIAQGDRLALPTNLTINNYTYQLALGAPRPGEFAFNSATGQIAINLLSPLTVATTAIVSGTSDLETDYIGDQVPDIFTRIPLMGVFEETLSFDGQPSGSCNFDCDPIFEEQIKKELVIGTEFTAFGVGYRVSSLSFKKSLIYPYTVGVSLSLGGRHENYDIPVPLKGPVSNNAGSGMVLGLDPNCIGTAPGSLVGSIGSYTTVQILAQKAGGAFDGPLMKIPIPVSVPSEGTSFIAEAQKQAAMYGGFLVFDKPNAVTFRRLPSQVSLALTPDKVKTDISATTAGRLRQTLNTFITHPNLQPTDPFNSSSDPFISRPENVKSYPWVKAYDPPFKLEGKFNTIPFGVTVVQDSGARTVSIEVNQSFSQYQRPAWRSRTLLRQIISTPLEDPSISPPVTGSMKDLSLLFDNSGMTKTQTTEDKIDGITMSETTKKYGFAYTLGKDLFYARGNVTGASPQWVNISEASTNHLYDDGRGYYLGSNTTGKDLVRYKQESSGMETAKLSAQDSVESDILSCYNYFQNPTVAGTRYYLEPFRNYYTDIPIPPIQKYLVCLPSGASQPRFVEDPTWVEDYFVVTKTTYENSFAARSDPEHYPQRGIFRQPLVTGKEAFFKEWTTILPSKNTTTKPSTGTKPDNMPRDMFVVTTANYGSQDSGFINNLSINNSVTNEGRPAVHTRKPSQREKVPNLVFPKNIDALLEQIANRSFNDYVYSGISPDIKTSSGGTLSYPSAETFNQAMTAARTELTIANLTGGTKEDFGIEFNTTTRPGDLITYTLGDNIVRTRFVLSVTRRRAIDSQARRPMLLAKDCNISVGIWRTPLVFHGRRPGTKITRMFVPDRSSLGEILDPIFRNRRNFSV